MSKATFTALIWEEDGMYVSKCLEIEVASAGDSPQEALENLKEAIELWLENAKELGLLEDYSAALSTKQKFTSQIEMDI
ncbi:MAG: type II toxin-antitoxin system HicB family antitoxin [Candidatus Heimdallarchaeota archaeon]